MSSKAKQQGNEYFSKGKYKQAQKFYTIAIEQTTTETPQSEIAIYYSNRANALLRQNLYEECIQDCDQAISKDPTYFKSYYHKASALFCLQKFEESEKEVLSGLIKCNKDSKDEEIEDFLEQINQRKQERDKTFKKKKKKEETDKKEEEKSNPNFNFHSSFKSKEEMLKDLFPNSDESEFSDYLKNNSSMHYAARDGDLDSIKILFKLGANINEKGNMLITPLHWAAQHGNLQSVKFLIENGAELEALTNLGTTPLNLALSQPSGDDVFERISYLIDKGANINHEEDFGSSLHFASEIKHRSSEKILEKMIEHGALINKVDNDGNTALDRALMSDNFVAAKLLKKFGAVQNNQQKRINLEKHDKENYLKKEFLNKKQEAFDEMKKILSGKNSDNLDNIQCSLDICLVCDTYHEASYRNTKFEQIKILNSACKAQKHEIKEMNNTYKKIYRFYTIDNDIISGFNPYSIWLTLIESHIIEHWEKSTGLMRVGMKAMMEYYQTNINIWRNSSNEKNANLFKLWSIFFMKMIIKDDIIRYEEDERRRFLFLLEEKDVEKVIALYEMNPLAKSQKDHDDRYPFGGKINKT